MKIKLAVVDLELSRHQKRLAAALAVPVIIAAAGAVAYAAVPTMWKDGDVLKAADLNANFTAVDNRVASVENMLPPGTIMSYGGTPATSADGGAPVLPLGWLLCDGSPVSRTTYAALFAAVGISFGGGDGVATFNLPDLRGRFLRGADRGSGRDPDGDRAVGSTQADSFKSHNHGGSTTGVSNSSGTDPSLDYNLLGCGQSGVGFAYVAGQNCFNGKFSGHYHGIQAEGGGETRPINVAINYLIKY
jgi:microcystin-dependent protein